MTDAKTDWERRIYRRVTETSGADPASELPATTGLVAQPGNGFVRLSGDAVRDAAGYVIERGPPARPRTTARSSPTAAATSRP